MTTFEDLGLDKDFLKVIEHLKFEKPTEIQEKAIPLSLEGKDIIGGSATGSGKTLAFGAAIIEKTNKGDRSRALILAPTRELAEQVGKSLRVFAAYKKLNVAIVYGGVGISPQIDDLRHAEIIVGTPGRILDHMERGTINLKNIKFLVLDEADRMLDMGFIEDVDRIISACPRERQTMLFSATISSDIEHLAKKYMKSPTHVAVESYVDPSKLHQSYYDVPKHLKFSLLVHLLKGEKEGLVMVFCNTRRNVDFIAKNLKNHEIPALAIHGGLTQNRRSDIMERFHSGRVLILVCTDVAARGLDIKDVSHVYNYDIPKNPKEYIHRIGRTARAGREGKAINIVSQMDYQNFRSVLQDDSLNIEQKEVPELAPLRVEFEQRGRGEGRSFGGGGRSFGGRGGGGGQRGRSYGGGRGGDRPRSRYGDRGGGGRSSGSHSGGQRGERRSFGRPKRY